MKIKGYIGLGIAMVPFVFMGCGLPHSSDAHGVDHTDTTDHGHELDAYGGPVDPVVSYTLAGLTARGAAVYKRVCIHCHQENGEGIREAYPPLASSDFLMADRKRPIEILLKCLKGEITVNGNIFNSEMPAVTGSDLSIAAVLTYVRNQFNGAADSIGASEVKSARSGLGL